MGWSKILFKSNKRIRSKVGGPKRWKWTVARKLIVCQKTDGLKWIVDNRYSLKWTVIRQKVDCQNFRKFRNKIFWITNNSTLVPNHYKVKSGRNDCINLGGLLSQYNLSEKVLNSFLKFLHKDTFLKIWLKIVLVCDRAGKNMTAHFHSIAFVTFRLALLKAFASYFE